jgi:hypothetical protein
VAPGREPVASAMPGTTTNTASGPSTLAVASDDEESRECQKDFECEECCKKFPKDPRCIPQKSKKRQCDDSRERD